MKRKATEKKGRRRRIKKINLGAKTELLMREFLNHLVDASYQVALKIGFRGTFIAFLSDLQEALDKIIQKDHTLPTTAHH
ncbi:MAG: hypothetical protein U1F57_04875 [bacterium]